MLENLFLEDKSTIYSKVEGENIVNLLDPNFKIPNAELMGNTIISSKDTIARPDIIAEKLYGNQTYGNLLCKVNGIQNPFELNENVYLFAPAPIAVNEFINSGYDEDELIEEDTIYDSDDSSSSSKKDSNTPTAKTKKEKRSPNEAVVGDTRFKINYGKRIVVY